MTMTTRKRHSPEQVVRKLTTADRLLAEGKDVAAVCRELGISEPTYHRWRNQFGGLKAEDAKRLKDLERENATLKRLLADAELEKAAFEGDRPGKLLSPERRRAAVHHLTRTMNVSERFACRVTGQHRAAQRSAPSTSKVHVDHDRSADSPPRNRYTPNTGSCFSQALSRSSTSRTRMSHRIAPQGDPPAADPGERSRPHADGRASRPDSGKVGRA